MRVALVHLIAYGDCLFATLVARQIKRDHPGCHLTWVIGDKYASIIEGNPHVDAVHKIVLGIRDEAFSSGWQKAKIWVADQVRMGNIEKVYSTQILPDNVRYWDGLVRTSMYGAYGKPITGPHLPEVLLTEAENRNVADFAVKHRLHEFKHVFLFECGPSSGQSPLTPPRAEALAHAVGKTHPEVVFLMSSTETLVQPSPQVVDASCLTYRENAALARHCTGLIGCSSGITWLTTSTAGKALPMLQILTKSTEAFKFASVALDFRRVRLDESSVIEMAEPSDKRIIRCIEKWLSESHSAARRKFHEELVLTSAHAEKAYWTIRQHFGKTAAKSATVRFVRANGFGTIPWRVLIAPMRGKEVALKTAAKRLLRAPLRALGIDVVRWRPPKPQPVVPAEELEIIAAFGPQYKPEDHWLRTCGIQTVLDVGAHEGEFAQRIRAILPGADLICFEPLQGPFAKLTERFKGQPNFRAIRCALGEKAGQHEIHHNEYAPSSSLLPMAELHKQSFPFAIKQKTEMIEVRKLSDVVRELDLRDPLLLKLDVQGFEDKVIAGGEDVVVRAKVIIIEVSFQTLYEGGPLFDDVYRLLKGRGFTYNGNFEQLPSPRDGRILQADAIFCRQ